MTRAIATVIDACCHAHEPSGTLINVGNDGVGVVMRRGTWVAIAAVALVVASPFVLTAPLPSGNLVEVRDRFEPQGYARSPRVALSRAGWCASATAPARPSRHWIFDAPFSSEELQQWLDDAAYPVTVDGDCSTGYCEVFGTSGAWTVQILVGPRTSSNEQVELSLYLKD